MRWNVYGAASDSGREVTALIQAPTAAAAERTANRHAIFVAGVRPAPDRPTPVRPVPLSYGSGSRASFPGLPGWACVTIAAALLAGIAAAVILLAAQGRPAGSGPSLVANRQT